MHDLTAIKARNARAMEDADKTDRSARHMLSPTSMEGDTEHKPTALQIAARDALTAAALAWLKVPQGDPRDAALEDAIRVYREAYKL